MKISLNGLNDPSNIVVLPNCPTILTVSDPRTGTKKTITFTIKDLSKLDTSTEYYIKLGSYEIISTNLLNNANGNNFYITNSNTIQNQITVANSIVNAINTIGQIIINFNVSQQIIGNSFQPVVTIQGKEVGAYALNIETNIPSNAMQITEITGSLTSTFKGNIKNKVCVDVYKIDSPTDKIGSTVSQSGNYLMTLEKNVFGDDTSFDLSPVIQDYCEYGDVSQFTFNVYSIVDYTVTNLASFTHVFANNGYMVNQGVSFIPKFDNVYLAQNVSRGMSRTVYNNSILYIYYPEIVLSLYANNTVSASSFNIKYLDGAFANLYTENYTLQTNNNLSTADIKLNEQYFNQAAYVDVEIPYIGTIRYNVIKPIHATGDCQRIYWYNSYGGVSFFDFTGNRTEERKTTIETYSKSNFDYYTKNVAEKNMIYDKSVEITVTLTSHNMQKDGTWQLFDLQNSIYAWTFVNGKKYAIQINDIKIDESDVKNIYVGEIEYVYSKGDTD